MPERQLWARCDSCEKIFEGNLAWELEDGFCVLNLRSLLLRVLNVHHRHFSEEAVHHQLFWVYSSRAEAERRGLRFGFINMSSEGGATAQLDE